MDNVLELTYLFMLVLLLALTVERVMEVLQSIWGYIEWKTRRYNYWNGKAKKLKRQFELKAKSQILLRVIDLTPLTRQIRYATTAKEGHSGKLTIISGEMIRQTSIAAVSRIVASLLGVAFCWVTKVNFVEVFEKAMEMTPGRLTNWPPELQLIISGIVVGLGSEPVHNLISSLESRRKSRAEKAGLEKALGKTQ